MKLWKIAAGDWIWDERITRFFRVGAVLSKEDALHRIAELGFDGVELSWVSPETYPPEKVKAVSETIEGLGLDIANAYIDTAARWPFGAFTNSDGNVRRAVVQHVGKCMEIARELGSNMVNLWMGSDYLPLKVDYWTAWNWAVQVLSQCVDLAEGLGLKVSLEYKLREPGEFHLIANSDALLRVIDEVGSRSMGATVDTGHVFQAKEHLPTTIDKLRKVLFHIHLGDNYGNWDDDLPVGEVHNFMEFFKALKLVGYKGYLSLDIWPMADPDRAALQSKKYIEEVLEKM